jgi:hypothetical protein
VEETNPNEFDSLDSNIIFNPYSVKPRLIEMLKEFTQPSVEFEGNRSFEK